MHILVKSDFPNSRLEFIQNSFQELSSRNEIGLHVVGFWNNINRLSTRSYGIFEIDEQDFDSGYEKLKNIFSEIRNNVPEYKYKFEPVYDCLKAKQDAEEVSSYLDHENKGLKSELEFINLYNWHEFHEFFG